jgi:transcriptional/translational regulatory protein YebC/TACO1
MGVRCVSSYLLLHPVILLSILNRSDVVERNIKKAVEKPTDYKELVYECYGVGGVGFILTMLSDSNNRAASAVNAAVRKLGEKSSPSFKMGSSGSVLFNFEKKARLTLLSTISEDQLIELAIRSCLLFL